MRGACPLQPTQVSHAPAFALAGLESLVRRQRHAPPVAGSTLCTALCPPPPNHQLRLIPIPHLAQGTVQLLPNGSAAFLHHNNAKLRLDGSGDRSLPALNRLTAPAAEDLAATLITNGYRLQAAAAPRTTCRRRWQAVHPATRLKPQARRACPYSTCLPAAGWHLRPQRRRVRSTYTAARLQRRQRLGRRRRRHELPPPAVPCNG